MAKARSPSYPVIGLKDAIERIGRVYKEDYQNAIPRTVVADHIGYKSLNGASLGVLAALMKYGLLEGRGDNSRVSDLAVQIIAHPPGSPERAAAILDAAGRPELFAELDKRFAGGRGSDTGIKSYLLTQKFIPPAADTAIRAYRETKQLVEAEFAGYTPPDSPQENAMQQPDLNKAPPPAPPGPAADAPLAPGSRRAVFDLTEGEVEITYPAELSPESVADLQDYITVFMKKAKREAGIS